MELLYSPGFWRRPPSLAEGMRSIQLPDKRILAYSIYGASIDAVRLDPKKVVLYFHGTPSCALEAQALEEDAASTGMAIIAADRPGIGSSSYDSKLSVRSVAADSIHLLDALEIPVVSVVGVSGARGKGRVR